jgi:dTDP-4-dehydrorhamnose 3,5-epimerase-like enzyme
MNPISISELDNRGDQRGVLFSIEDVDLTYLGSIKNMHFGKISTHSIRGNHYHIEHKEMIVITYFDQWKLCWEVDDLSVQSEKNFAGTGAVMIKIDPGVAHTIINTGTRDLSFISLTDKEYDPDNPDTYRKSLIKNGQN